VAPCLCQIPPVPGTDISLKEQVVQFDVLPDAESAAQQAARIIADHARQAIAERGLFTLAVSGGRSPWIMLRHLTQLDVSWPDVHIFQVDERVAPAGDPDRNLTHLQESLLRHVPLPLENCHAMPVEAGDLTEAAAHYAAQIESLCGQPARIDLVHLGLGADGHTASLVPGDAALEISDRDVALAGPYQSRERMTLTYPILNRSRSLLWLVTGHDKTIPLKQLLAADPTIPAGRVALSTSLILADAAAADGIHTKQT